MTICVCGMLENHTHLGTFTVGLVPVRMDKRSGNGQVYLIDEQSLMLRPNDILAAWPGRKVALVLLEKEGQHPS